MVLLCRMLVYVINGVIECNNQIVSLCAAMQNFTENVSQINICIHSFPVDAIGLVEILHEHYDKQVT